MFLRAIIGVVCLVFSCLVVSSERVAAQGGDDFALSFTPGFAGDGFDYPFSIGPSSSSGVGISPGVFFVPDSPDGTSLAVDYQGANLAFFDANNLLTRPSSRITNEAFWTDPREFTNSSNGFSLSSLGFTVDVFNSNAAETVGFDLAVASVAAPLPDALSFQIQFGVEDFFGGDPGDPGGPDEVFFFNGDIALVDNFGFDDFIVDTGTFQTLGSPFGGRDVSVELDLPSLYAEAVESGGGGGFFDGDFSSFQGPIFIDIDTSPLDNNNGISVNQVAIDNLSVNGGVPSNVRTEPEIVNGPTPNGPFNPTIFSLTGPPNANVVNVPNTTQTGPIGLSVTSGPFTDPGDFQVTLYTPGNANVSGLSEATFGFGPTTVPVVSAGGPTGPAVFGLTEEVQLTLVGDLNQAGILPTVFETEALVDANLAGVLEDVFLTAEALADPLTVGEALELGLPVISGFGSALSDSALFLTGVSANDFLNLLAQGEADLLVGTQGAAFAPSFNSLGELTGGRVSSFLVTDSSGSFTTKVVAIGIPEPTSSTVLALSVIAMALGRRRP